MNRFEKWSLWISVALTTVTGAGLFWAKYLLQANDPWAVVNHPLQPWLLKAHIITAPMLIFALGLISTRHIWRHYMCRLAPGRKSGIVTVLVTVPMIIGGYLIQVVTHVGWLRVLAISHIALGFLFAAGFVLHQMFVRRLSARCAGPAEELAAPRAREPRERATAASGYRSET
ncbi:MAG: hypothetical protein V3U13_03200 [Gemmatimonadota bacterium]